LPARPDWPERLEQIGFTYHSADSGYWREDAAYEFSDTEIDRVEAATDALHQLCLEAVDRVIREDRFGDLRIPEAWKSHIIDSWERREPSLYGRFDLWYDGSAEPKLIEYNADTPTSLLEASVAQWFWLQETQPEADQFNSLHERLIGRWTRLRHESPTDLLHLACLRDSEEDRQNLVYLADTALQAGWRIHTLAVDEIGWDGANRRFVDQSDTPMDVLFKLYPWEWMNQDVFAAYLSPEKLSVIEPAWKQVLSHKGLLALLWEWFAGHPNLLPAALSEPIDRTSYVQKPFWSREGANVTIVSGARVMRTEGPYDRGASVFQQYCPLPEFAGWHPVLGSWVVGEEPAGMGIREDRGLIHGNTSRFVPHFFVKEVRVP
jgi:glutathionylspermidine synthase